MEKILPLKRGRGRPPKTDNSQRETRERLIRSGVEVLTEKGLASTGIDEVLKKVGVPKGSFYHYFSSKDDFGLVLIDNYASFFAHKLDRWLLNEARTPLARLQDFVDDAKEGLSRFDFRRGCLIGNLGQELGALNDSFRQPLEDVFLDWQTRVATCLQAAKDVREISPEADCEQLASFFWIGWEGAVLRTKLVRNTSPIDLFTQAFFAGLPRS
ncbi:MAG: TetR/AcrR family transcriptional regulator [Alphaproteobacteria bacterium]|nr:TetR/AcrR family transcriptional regulator [Alphaproteobacteria bacterium]